MIYKGKAILRQLSTIYDELDKDHTDMLSSVAHHLNMDDCILSYLEDGSAMRIVFNDTPHRDRIFALMVSLRDVASMDIKASALVQKIG